MENLIKERWYGNITPCEHCGAHDPEIDHLMTLLEQNRENLRTISTEEQMAIFEKYADCEEEYLMRMMDRAFCDGFRLGGRLLAEVMLDV